MMNIMEWSECTQNVVTNSGAGNTGSSAGGGGNVPTNGGGAAAIGIDHHHIHHHHHPNIHHHHHHRDTHHHHNNTNHHLNHQIVSAAPTIKNHSVTHFNGYLYCFGGYDGRRNHMTLLLYSIQQQRWIRPYHISTSNTSSLLSNNNNNNNNTTNTIPTSPSSVQSNSSSTVNSLPNDTNSITSDDTYRPPANATTTTTGNVLNASSLSVVSSSAAAAAFAAALANAGISGSSNNNTNDNTSIIMQGTPPPGRNGHSATLATDPDDDEQGRIIIIGGWLGTGPLAASDMHVLDISHINDNSNNRRNNRNRNNSNNNTSSSQPGGSFADGSRQLLRWYQPAVKGTPPGPCNMHSADYVMNRKEVYVFRGGNGREYLNDLHALHVDTLTWRKVTCTGTIPQQRANHSSAILDKPHGRGGSELFIFGGWNGTERLNDIHILDTDTSTWTAPHVAGVLPHPRAGMTLTALRGRLYLFGGSGTSAKCFQDLQILDRQEMAWLDVVCDNEQGINANNSMNSTNTNNTGNNGAPGSGNLGGGGVVGAQGMVNDNNRFRFGGSRMYGNTGGHALLDDPSITSLNGDIIEARPQQQGGTQDYASIPSYGRAGNDPWRLPRDNNNSNPYMLHQQQYASPNPNDEDTVPSVLVRGHGPGRRAGHTATAVNRKIYIFGGSCGSDYLNDFFVLDTDPPPSAAVTEPNPLLLMERRLRHFFNDPEFADVVFVVGEHKDKVYGHKMVLSIVSDCFRAMFTTGFKESDAMEIAIPDCTHAAFLSVMEYIYTGTLPSLLHYHHYNNNNQQAQQQQQHLDGSTIHSTNSCASTNAYMMNSQNLLRIVEILEIADRFFLDHLKQVCEQILQTTVNGDTVEFLLSVASKTNSVQLQSICQHYYRNNDTSLLRSNNNTTVGSNYPTPSPPTSGAGHVIIPSASFDSTQDIVTPNNNNIDNTNNNNDSNLDNSILSSSSSSDDSTIETTNGNDAP